MVEKKESNEIAAKLLGVYEKVAKRISSIRIDSNWLTQTIGFSDSIVRIRYLSNENNHDEISTELSDLLRKFWTYCLIRSSIIRSPFLILYSLQAGG